MDQINILVVDDEREIADLVEIYLVSDGYKVYKANNALEGLEIIEKEDIHLVLLDMYMKIQYLLENKVLWKICFRTQFHSQMQKK